jgi:phosphonate transport system permease protein
LTQFTPPAALRHARRPWRGYALMLVLGVMVFASISVLEWDLSALLDPEKRARSLDRLGDFFSSFGAPNLEGDYLRRALHLCAQTLSTALIGTLLGAVVGYVIALGASRAVILGDERRPPLTQPFAFSWYMLRKGFIEGSRLVLDVFRGVPDFAWAILILTVPGPGPVTGVLAIGLSVAGILGKIYSEIWDGIDPSSYAVLRNTGAGRVQTFLFGIQPLASRSMLSYTLMRAECAVRNASVIGAVGGGGLGADMFDEFNFGNYDNVVTLLIFMLLLTASVDLLSNLLRYQLRSDPNHPRTARGVTLKSAMARRVIGLAGVVGVLAFCWRYLRVPYFLKPEQRSDSVGNALEELDRIEWEWIWQEFSKFLEPELGMETIKEAVIGSGVPVAMAVLGTLGGVLIAMLLTYPGSVGFQTDSYRFTGEYRPVWVRMVRWGQVMLARLGALTARAVPEVAWVWLLATFFTLGVLPGVIAIAIHSAGVLARVFIETVDNVPYRRFEQAYQGSRPKTFLYAGVPASWKDWSTYSFFQFESNVRAGLVLGIIGVGGLGDAFHTSFTFWSLHRASTFLLMMILLTVIIDRTSRALKISRVTH